MSDLVEKIVDLVARHGVRFVRVSSADFSVTVRREPGKPEAPSRGAAAASPGQQAPSAPAEIVPEHVVVRSRTVGVFRHLDPPVAIGQVVQAGQTLGVVEAMRIPSDVRCETTGVVVEVLAEDGAPVEYDQPLFVLSGRLAELKGGPA